ncbi:hypothetical protein LIA77_00156 [Sarocladium implicatum]|nr:hypothetical protein LIA77_00156 [Sarocladium implicatum]
MKAEYKTARKHQITPPLKILYLHALSRPHGFIFRSCYSILPSPIPISFITMFSLTRYLRHQLRPIFRWTRLVRSRHPTPLLESQSQSPLLELNADVVIFIMSFLPHTDRLSAALSCKSLHFVCDKILYGLTAPLSTDDKADFLFRLERDLMATHIYCAICIKLHRYSSLNKPTQSPASFWFQKRNRPTCLGPKYRYSPLYANNYFAYHHGRAAMNRHFHGPPAGVDQDSLRYETTRLTADKHMNCSTWSSRYSVRIVCDSLFLYGEHAMDSTDISSMMKTLDEGSHDICHHITTKPIRRSFELLTRVAGLVASEISQFLQQPGRVVHGSCTRCLTDYTVEIIRKSRHSEAGVYYQVRIQTYHDFGQFRSPEEWKWMVWRHVRLEDWIGEPRDVQLYPPGSVRLQYCADKDRENGGKRSFDRSV